MMAIIFLVLTSLLLFITPSTLCQMFSTYGGGEWQLLHESIGISAMHMQLLHNNKVVIFDRTDFGLSNLSLPLGRCRVDPLDNIVALDCTAHSVLYDIESNTFRPLMVQTDTWCSSGAVLPDGTLIQTGGYNDGDHNVRTFTPCDGDACDWVEIPNYLSERRWYSSNQRLPDARIIIVGGRRQFNYEFYPRNSDDYPVNVFELDLLRETSDYSENNLYPFLYLLPDGNLFIFANTRSIVFDHNQNRVVRELPPITGGDPRNYPSSGSSVLLPLDENGPIVAEVMVCGGAPSGAYESARESIFVRAIPSCGRIVVTDQNPSWIMEMMPTGRVMGDMLILPTGDIIIINGAGRGTAGWENARSPVLQPLIYNPSGPEIGRFSVMESTSKPRLYHSAATLLSDGRILVGGSNPHVYYNFSGVEFPTDLSLEAFLPPYLSASNDEIRPTITYADAIVGYGHEFSMSFRVERFLKLGIVSARIIAPSFTTHAFAMNQRMVVLKVIETVCTAPDTYRLAVVGPSKPEIAPSGYYLLFVVHGGIPSSATWVKVQ